VAELVRHFTVNDVRRGRISYRDAIWQQRALALITLPDAAPGHDAYIASLARHDDEFARLDAVCIVTRDPVSGAAPGGVIIADRWGEIAHTRAGLDVEAMPGATELLEWLDYVQRQCPECQGEVR
jgi:hypothetical protein